MKKRSRIRWFGLHRALGVGSVATLMSGAALAAMPAPAQPPRRRPAPFIVPGPGLPLFPGTGAGTAPSPWRVVPKATDRCLVPVAEFDPKFVIQARAIDERMIVPPLVVGRSVARGRLAPKH